MAQMQMGTATGTGAALPIEVGFVPEVVILLNLTTAGLVVWTHSMAAAKCMTVKAAAVYTATEGITALDNIYKYSAAPEVETKYTGFMMGTNCNAAADVIVWAAFRE
jgi:hypothetical protein